MDLRGWIKDIIALVVACAFPIGVTLFLIGVCHC